MPHQRSTPAALERFGVRPSLDPGWQDRGSASFSPRCVVAHHTGFDRDVTGILRNGHGNLPGPLCNVELRRSGHVHVIAAGRANHAGRGGWRGLSGNSSALGIEASSAGQSWTDAQLEAWPRICAGLLWMIGRDESWLCGHREWTSRKWDPGALNLDWLRRSTAALLRGAPGPAPTPTPTPTIQEDEDMIMFWHKGGLFLVSGGKRSPGGLDPKTADALTAAGIKRVGKPSDDSTLFHILPPFK